MRRVGACDRVFGFLGRAVALSLLLILVTAPALAGSASVAEPQAVEGMTSIVPSPPRLVYADTELWQTHLLIQANGPSRLRYTNCFQGLFEVKLGGSGEPTLATVPNFSRNLCAPGDAGLAPMDADGDLSVVTLAEFLDADTGDVAAFVIPPLRWAMPAFRLRADAIQSDATYKTSIALFNDGTTDAPVTLRLFDAHGAPAGTESTNVPANGFVLYELAGELPLGRLELEAGYAGFGFASDSPVYGFAVVTWRTGGSPRVVELTPIIPAPSGGD